MMSASPRLSRPSLLGVLYAEDFDELGEDAAASPEPVAEPEIIEPMFTAAELDAARAEAMSAGRKEAEQGLASARNGLLSHIADAIVAAQADARAVAEQAAEGVAGCMLSALAACLPSLCAQHGAAELRALVSVLLPALTDELRVTVRINPLDLTMLQDEIGSLDAEIAERIHLLPTEAVLPGDARVTWADGSAARNTARARAVFEDGLAELGLLQREQADA